MSRRDRARRRRNRVREYDQQHGPDLSEIVYVFEDGWMIRRPGDAEGMRREGELLENCLARARQMMLDGGMSLEQIDALTQGLHSLRDTNNVPHVAWLHIPGSLGWPGFSAEITGFQDSDPKPEYVARVDAWHETLPYAVYVTKSFDGIEGYEELLDALTDSEDGVMQDKAA